MNTLVVSAHDENDVHVAALFNVALGVLERANHKVSVSELYAQGFNPLTSKLDFKISSVVNTEYILEQQRAVNTGTGFSPDIQAEMDKVKAADLIIIHFPLRYSAVPAVLKGWLERVLAMGFAWDGNKRYENGLMRGKKVLVSAVAADPDSFYSADGMHRATVTQHLFPLLHSTLAFCGFSVYEPFILSNSIAAAQEDVDAETQRYKQILEQIDSYNSYLYP